MDLTGEIIHNGTRYRVVKNPNNPKEMLVVCGDLVSANIYLDRAELIRDICDGDVIWEDR